MIKQIRLLCVFIIGIVIGICLNYFAFEIIGDVLIHKDFKETNMIRFSKYLDRQKGRTFYFCDAFKTYGIGEEGKKYLHNISVTLLNIILFLCLGMKLKRRKKVHLLNLVFYVTFQKSWNL